MDQDDKPIEDVSVVSLADPRAPRVLTVTTANGEFVLEHPAASDTLEFRCPPYVPTTRRDVRAGSTLRVSLQSGHSRSYVVVAQDTDEPIPDAAITVRNFHDPPDAAPTSYITDGRGEATIIEPNDPIVLDVTAGGFLPLEDAKGEFGTSPRRIRLTRASASGGASIFVRVVDADTDAQVPDPTFDYGCSETLRDGVYRIVAVALTSGRAQIAGSAPGYSHEWFAIGTQDHGTPDAAFVMRLHSAGQCRGLVHEVNGASVAGAEITALLRDPFAGARTGFMSQQRATARSAADGSFLLDHLVPGGEYVITVIHPDHVAQRFTWVATPFAPIDITLEPATPFVVVAVDHTGGIVRVTEIEAVYWLDWDKFNARVDPVGDGSVRVTVGTWRVSMRLRGEETGEEWVRLDAEPIAGRVDVALPIGVRARCVVRDATGLPVPDALVTAEAPWFGFKRKVHTDPNGTAMLIGLRPTTWTIAASHGAASSPDTRLRVPPDASQVELALTLTGPTGVRCDLRGSDGAALAGGGRIRVLFGDTEDEVRSEAFESADDYVFIELTPDMPCQIEVNAKGHGPSRSAQIQLARGEIRTLRFDVRPLARAAFEVRAPQGVPVHNVALALRREQPGALPVWLPLTDDTGRAGAEGLAAGVYRVHAVRITGAVRSPDATLSLAVAPVRLELAPGDNGVITLTADVEKGAPQDFEFGFEPEIDGKVTSWSFTLADGRGRRHAVTLKSTAASERTSRATIPFLPAGVWDFVDARVTVRGAGDASETRSVSFTPAQLVVTPGSEALARIVVSPR